MSQTSTITTIASTSTTTSSSNTGTKSTQTSKNANTNDLLSSFHFQASLKTHVYHVLLCIAFMAVLRLSPIKALVRPALDLLAPRRFHDNDASGKTYQPLHWWNWIVHFMPMVINLEIMACFRRLANFSTNNTTTGDKKQSNKLQAFYHGLYVVYIMAHVQGLLDVASHSQINVTDSLERQLGEWGDVFMKIHVFGAGTSILLGEWSLIPVAGLTATGMLTMKNPAGISLSTSSLLTVLWQKELPLGFKAAWIVLCALPAFAKNVRLTDVAHFQFVLALSAALIVLTYSLQRKVEHDVASSNATVSSNVSQQPKKLM